MSRPRYTEAQVMGYLRILLTPSALGVYKTGVAGRSPATKGTAGFPDFTILSEDPVPHVLYVETKGRNTAIPESQWIFQARAAIVGQPTLIVRSPGALLNGLRYLRLLPERIVDQPGSFWDQWDQSEWPENVWYMEMMGERFWGQRGQRWAGGTIPPDASRTTRRPPWPLGPAWE